MRVFRSLMGRVDVVLDRWSAKSSSVNVVLSTMRTVVVGVKILAIDSKHAWQHRHVQNDFRVVAQRSRVLRELALGVPLAVWFNIPIVGNSFLLIAILFPSILPISWRSHRQRVRDFAEQTDNDMAFVKRLREKRLSRENQLLAKSVRELSQREVEEALFDRRVKVDNLMDWKGLPRFTHDNNGINRPVSMNSLEALYTQLEHTIKMKS